MKGLGTVFKEVYGKGLEPYGFKRIKGKQPYYVRVVTDEIINIISFKSENNYCFNQGYRRFAVVCGIATIYRPFIDLDKTVRENYGFRDAWSIYKEINRGKWNEATMNELYNTEYLEKNEESLVESMKKSFFLVRENILPILDSINDIYSCIDFFRKIQSPVLNICKGESFGRMNPNKEDNESLIAFKIDNMDRYEKGFKEYIEFYNTYEAEEKKAGRFNETDDRLYARKVGRLEWLESSLKEINNMRNNPEINKQIIEEMEFRKNRNTQALREHGVLI